MVGLIPVRRPIVPKLVWKLAHWPTLVPRTARTRYSTLGEPGGIVSSTKRFAPDAPRYLNSPLGPVLRYTWYIVPAVPRGFLHFHRSASEPSCHRSALNECGDPGGPIGEGFFRAGMDASAYTPSSDVPALARICNMTTEPSDPIFSMAVR